MQLPYLLGTSTLGKVADGTGISFWASEGTVQAVDRDSDGVLFHGVVKDGQAKCRVFTRTINPYEPENNPTFERAETSLVEALVGEARGEQQIEFVWASDEELRLHGTPVIIGDHIQDGTTHIIKPGDVLQPVPFFTSADITVTGPPGKTISASLENNFLPRLVFPMNELAENDLVEDIVGDHDGIATNISVDLVDKIVGAGSFVFNGTSVIEVPDASDLQIANNLAINLFIKLDTLGQQASLLKRSGSWNLFVDQSGSVHFKSDAGEEVISLAPLSEKVWHSVTLRIENRQFKLGVDSQIAIKNMVNDLPSTSQPLFIGEFLIGKLDHVELASTLDTVIQIEGPTTLSLDSQGVATITVRSTGAFAGRKLVMRPVFLEITGSPTIHKPIGIATLDVYTEVAQFAEGVFSTAIAGGELILDFTIVGDVKDLTNFLIDLWPGGDSPDLLSGAIAIFSLATEFFPPLKPLGDATKISVKAAKRAESIAAGGTRAIKNANRGKRTLIGVADFAADNAKYLDDASGVLDEAVQESLQKVFKTPAGGNTTFRRLSASTSGNTHKLVDDLQRVDGIDPESVRSAARAVARTCGSPCPLLFSNKAFRTLTRISSKLGKARTITLARNLAKLRRKGKIWPEVADQLLRDVDDLIDPYFRVGPGGIVRANTPPYEQALVGFMKDLTKPTRPRKGASSIEYYSEFFSTVGVIKYAKTGLTDGQIELLKVIGRGGKEGPDLFGVVDFKGKFFELKFRKGTSDVSKATLQTQITIGERLGGSGRTAIRAEHLAHMSVPGFNPMNIDEYTVVWLKDHSKELLDGSGNIKPWIKQRVSDAVKAGSDANFNDIKQVNFQFLNAPTLDDGSLNLNLFILSELNITTIPVYP